MAWAHEMRTHISQELESLHAIREDYRGIARILYGEQNEPAPLLRALSMFGTITGRLAQVLAHHRYDATAIEVQVAQSEIAALKSELALARKALRDSEGEVPVLEVRTRLCSALPHAFEAVDWVERAATE